MEVNGILAAFLANPSTQLALRTVALCTTALYVATIYWAIQDARTRVTDARGVAALAVAAAIPFIGLILYVMIRPSRTLDEARESELAFRAAQADLARSGQCTRCGASTERDWRICPHCRAALATACPSCARPVRIDWAACAYCAADLTPRVRSAEPVRRPVTKIA